jgi:hypothetical protein
MSNGHPFPDDAALQEYAVEQIRQRIAEIVGPADAERMTVRLVASAADGLSVELKGPGRLAKKIADALSRQM